MAPVSLLIAGLAGMHLVVGYARAPEEELVFVLRADLDVTAGRSVVPAHEMWTPARL